MVSLRGAAAVLAERWDDVVDCCATALGGRRAVRAHVEVIGPLGPQVWSVDVGGEEPPAHLGDEEKKEVERLKVDEKRQGGQESVLTINRRRQKALWILETTTTVSDATAAAFAADDTSPLEASLEELASEAGAAEDRLLVPGMEQPADGLAKSDGDVDDRGALAGAVEEAVKRLSSVEPLLVVPPKHLEVVQHVLKEASWPKTYGLSIGGSAAAGCLALVTGFDDGPALVVGQDWGLSMRPTSTGATICLRGVLGIRPGKHHLTVEPVTPVTA